MRTDLCSCLGHLQDGCEAMAISLLVLMPHEQTHGAFSILKQIEILSPDGTKARAVTNVMKLVANSLSVAKVAPTSLLPQVEGAVTVVSAERSHGHDTMGRAAWQPRPAGHRLRR